LSTIETVSGKHFPVEYVGRREGDSPVLVANNTRAQSILGWEPRYDLTAIIETAWNWHRSEPERERPAA
jgi:UDP-glucose 4-epimerase